MVSGAAHSAEGELSPPLGSYSKKEHQDGLKSAFARRRRRYFFSPRCYLYTKRHGALPRRSLGAVGCVALFAVCVCKVRRRNTHAAHQTPDATGFYATSLSAPVTRAFIKIEQASSATSPAKHSSPRAYRVRGKATDAPHGNGSREHVGHSARCHTNTGMLTQRIIGSGGITPTVLRSNAALLVVHGELGALGARFRRESSNVSCILQSMARARLLTAIGLDSKPRYP